MRVRGMYTSAILAAIAARPGIRAAEIADQVDCEVDAVERSIQYEIASGEVIREIVQVPNARSTCAFRMKPAPLAAPTPAPVAPTKTKVQLAVEFLQSQPDQRATTVQVRKAMGLGPTVSPNSYLRDALAADIVRKDNGIWSLGAKPLQARKAPEPKLKPQRGRAYLGEFMCAIRASGELHIAIGDVASMKLTAEQTREVARLFGQPA